MENISQFLIQYGFPVQYLWVVPIGLIIAGLIFVFFGSKAWRGAIFIAGLTIGYLVAVQYINPYLTGIPPYVSEVILGITIGFLLAWAIKAAIMVGMGAFVYEVLTIQHYYQMTIWDKIAGVFIGMAIGYWGYKKVTQIIATVLGGFALYFGLSAYVPSFIAIIVTAVFLIFGTVIQVYKHSTLIAKIKDKIKDGQA